MLKERVRREPDMSSDTLLDEIKNYFVPAHQENNIMSKWENNKQVTNSGTVRSISDVAIDFETLSMRLGTILPAVKGGTPILKISEFSKKQAFIAAIHPALRMEIEPDIDKDTIIWTDLVSKAEKKDRILRAAGKYVRNMPKHQTNHTSTSAIYGNPPRH